MAPLPQEYSLVYLLYLYLWPFWMFKDVTRGTMLERAAAYRHNREKRVFLPGYIVKWTIIFTALLGVTVYFEETARNSAALEFSCSVLACGAGILATSALVVTIVICVGHLLLTHWDR